jgi:hypothetical protein
LISYILGAGMFFLQNWLFALGCIIVGFNKLEQDFRKAVSNDKRAFLF